MKLFKNIILGGLIICGLFFSVQAQEFHILPELDDSELVQDDVKEVGNVHDNVNDEYESVWDKYKEISNDSKRSLWDRMASWIMSRDTLLDYVVYLIRFLSQVGLLIGAIMIVYAGYQYATDIMGGDASKWKSSVKYAIIWVVVISFSYAIIRILTNMFIE